MQSSRACYLVYLLYILFADLAACFLYTVLHKKGKTCNQALPFLFQQQLFIVIVVCAVLAILLIILRIAVVCAVRTLWVLRVLIAVIGLVLLVVVCSSHNDTSNYLGLKSFFSDIQLFTFILHVISTCFMLHRYHLHKCTFLFKNFYLHIMLTLDTLPKSDNYCLLSFIFRN